MGFTNKNLFYIDKSYPNILGRLYWDLDNKPFKPFNITDLNYNKINNLPKSFPDYLKHVTLIGVSDSMIIDKNISSICMNKDTENRKYFSNLSLYELQKLKDIKSSNITPSMYANIVKQYPHQVIDDGKRTKIPDTGLAFAENYRDDVLFYTDINQLEEELRTSCDTRVFGNSAYKLYNITVRLRMPFYQIHNIIMLDRNKYLQIKGFNYIPCDWNKRMDDKFSFSDICWCVITANIDTWGKICKLHVYEEINFLPTISFMYHCLLNYPYIKYGLKRDGLDEQRLLDNLYQTTRR